MAFMRLPFILFFMAMALPSWLQGVEEAYPRTSPGDIEVKALPAARLLLAESPKGYFESNNGLFMRLFRYIDSHQIPMTAPVEARMQPGVMVFYVDAKSAERRDLQSTEQVKLSEVPSRLVASIGIRGSYSQENFEEALAKLKAWLTQHPEYAVKGDAYGVYWNSPFVPFFLKHSEVHIPVEKQTPPIAPKK
jgi:effector-binding domain-containing protein